MATVTPGATINYTEGRQSEFDVGPEAPPGVKRRAEVEELEPVGRQWEFDVGPEAPPGVKRRAAVEEIEPGSRVRSRSLG